MGSHLYRLFQNFSCLLQHGLGVGLVGDEEKHTIWLILDIWPKACTCLTKLKYKQYTTDVGLNINGSVS